MGAQLSSTVFVKDPETHQTVELHPGTCPEPRLAALVTNPSAWVDGKLPRLPKAKTDTGQQESDGPESGSPSAGDQDDASGDVSDASAAADPSADSKETAETPAAEAKKPAARKPATRNRAAN
ncbi:hypothetical protein ACFQ6Q_00455 [Streptomyces sp. NPDC056437]|uniref:hypothetical protein n=1 Tax=Streptomyces sp. NPDC056437 TaxID=3345816 RepID=UPI0036826A0A